MPNDVRQLEPRTIGDQLVSIEARAAQTANPEKTQDARTVLEKMGEFWTAIKATLGSLMD